MFGGQLGNMLGLFRDMFGAIRNAVASVAFVIWTLFARFVDVIEGVFRRLAGLEQIHIEEATSESGAHIGGGGQSSTESGDIVYLLLNNQSIRQIFQNLIIVAVVLLMFFTIIQIIREQYRQKDGGQPHMIVFRMFKGMFLMLFSQHCM